MNYIILGYIITATRGQEFAFVQREVLRGTWTVRCIYYHIQY